MSIIALIEPHACTFTHLPIDKASATQPPGLSCMGASAPKLMYIHFADRGVHDGYSVRLCGAAVSIHPRRRHRQLVFALPVMNGAIIVWDLLGTMHTTRVVATVIPTTMMLAQATAARARACLVLFLKISFTLLQLSTHSQRQNQARTHRKTSHHASA